MIQLIAGFMQGITRVFISYPFDVVKIQMQKQLFKTTKETFYNIFKNDVFKFYRGSSIACLTVGTDRSLQFYAVEKLNNKYNPYVSGMFVSIISSVYNLPMQYLTTNIALFKKNEKIFDFIKKCSFKKLYTGYFIETPKNIISSSIYMGTYMKLRSSSDKKYLYPLYGGLSGIFMWTIIFPLDTIKTEYQTEKNINLIKNIKQRYYKHGIKSFYKGITPIYIRTFPSAFMGTYVYEKIRSLLN